MRFLREDEMVGSVRRLNEVRPPPALGVDYRCCCMDAELRYYFTGLQFYILGREVRYYIVDVDYTCLIEKLAGAAPLFKGVAVFF